MSHGIPKTKAITMTKVSYPPGLTLKESLVKKQKQGVWTEKEFPEGYVLGPYKGIIVFDPGEPSNNGYSFQICEHDHLSFILLGDSISLLPWLQFMSCDCYRDTFNVVATQSQDEFRFRTVKTLPPGTELVVRYLEVYGRDLIPSESESDKCLLKDSTAETNVADSYKS